MRRQVGSIRSAGPGAWRVELCHGKHDDGSRRRVSRNIRGTRRDAETLLARLLIEQGLGSDGMTLAEYVDGVYLPSCRERLRRRTVEGYEGVMTRQVMPRLGHMRLDALEPYMLERWVSGVPGTARTRLNAYRVLHAALRRAVVWRMIPSNPLDAVTPPRVERIPQDTLTQAEADALLDAFSGHVLEPIVALALGAGLRVSELAGLTWADVDFDSATVTIARGMHERGGEVWCEEPKSLTSRRTVSLPAWCVETLKPYRGIGPVVVERGEAMRPSRIGDLYRRRVRDAGLRWVPLKNLRHSHATLALEAGVDVVVVSRRLGHSSVAITDAFYLHPQRAADKDAAAKLERHRAESRVERQNAEVRDMKPAGEAGK